MEGNKVIMNDIIIERAFKQSQDTVFAFVTQTRHLLKWWGPEGVTVPVHNLNFLELGPWFSEMHGKNGQIYKVSGEVKSINPPHSIEFTWGWHDENDVRGYESLVCFEISSNGHEGSHFKLIHSRLPDKDSAQHHLEGWTSSLGRLEQLLG